MLGRGVARDWYPMADRGILPLSPAWEKGDPELCLFTPSGGREVRMSNARSSAAPSRATLELVRSLFPGQLTIPFTEAAAAIGWAPQTARNRLAEGTFPIPTLMLGSRRKVRIDHLAEFLDRTAAPIGAPRARKTGRPSKAEQARARAMGLTVPELRAREEAQGEEAQGGGQ